MIRRCIDTDFDAIYAIVNDAAQAYKGVIPADRWHEPYMPRDELQAAIDSGVDFWGFELDGTLVGVMGIQPVQDVTLIRHAYVRTTHRRHGIGGQLLQFLLAQTNTPTLIGTWAAAGWAIRFYQKHGFRLVAPEEKDRLLPRYWGVPQRQTETSVVLGDQRWFDALLSEWRLNAEAWPGPNRRKWSGLSDVVQESPARYGTPRKADGRTRPVPHGIWNR